MPVVGFLFSQSADPFADRLRELRQGLKETGYVEGATFRQVCQASAEG